MTPQTVLIYCDRAPVPWQVAAVHHEPVAVTCSTNVPGGRVSMVGDDHWRCSWCGARVKVVA